VQIRVSLWDFFLMFGTINQTAPDAVTISNFEAVYLSPPQAESKSEAVRSSVRRNSPGDTGTGRNPRGSPKNGQ
jgi:flagellar protein FlaG